MKRAAIWVLTAVGAVACAGPAADQDRRVTADTVIGPARVVDGDTLIVAGERVRLRHINAAELDTEEGRRAKAYMQDLVGQATVTCVGAARDRYARRLADCWAGGRDLGQAMIDARMVGKR